MTNSTDISYNETMTSLPAHPQRSAIENYNTDLIIEHFQSTPLSFIDDVINSVNDLLYQASTELERFVESEVGSIECVQGIHSIETLLESTIDKNFDKFEVFVLQNIFKLPENVKVTLPHYRDLNTSYTVDDDSALDKELADVHKRLKSLRYLNRKLKNEVSKAERQVEMLQEWIAKIGKIQLLMERDEVNISSSLPPLVSSLTKLHNLMSMLYARYPEFKSLTPKPEEPVNWVHKEVEKLLRGRDSGSREMGINVDGGGNVETGNVDNKQIDKETDSDRELARKMWKTTTAVGNLDELKKLNQMIAE